MNLPTHWSTDDGTEAIEISDADVDQATPVVSVVMTTYNHANFIGQALEGVLGQVTDFPVELIVGEDCSTDATRAIVDEYRRRYPGRIRLISAQRNVGPTRNLFRSIEKARGRYIAFCEGDDWWSDPFKLAKQVAAMEADPSIGCVHTDFAETRLVRGRWNLFSKEGVNRLRCPDRKMTGDLFSTAFSEHPTRFCTVIYRREVIIGFMESDFDYLKYTAIETAFLVFCAAKWTFEYLAEVTTVYRVSPGSLSRQRGSALIRVAQNRLQLYDDFKKFYGGRKDFDRAAEEIVLKDIAWKSFRGGDSESFKNATSRLSRIGAVPPFGSRLHLMSVIILVPLVHVCIARLFSIRDGWKLRIHALQKNRSGEVAE